MSLPNCPKCNSTYVYEDFNIFICPECNFEWSSIKNLEEKNIYKVLDANGNELNNGDSITIVKDLKVKGSSENIKQGDKAKNIKLVEEHLINDGHNISCKLNNFGAVDLKSEFVKKI